MVTDLYEVITSGRATGARRHAAHHPARHVRRVRAGPDLPRGVRGPARRPLPPVRRPRVRRLRIDGEGRAALPICSA
eukprot:6093152-Heterocapsa_arctica.AAC.1